MNSDIHFPPSVSEEDIRKEKDKARKLRASRWWRQKKGRGICFYCEGEVPANELTMDHIVPLIRGGKSLK
jgi:5-methylcytosine-specific restriction endonuclease McrA